jgi:hypothetical protein
MILLVILAGVAFVEAGLKIYYKLRYVPSTKYFDKLLYMNPYLYDMIAVRRVNLTPPVHHMLKA